MNAEQLRRMMRAQVEEESPLVEMLTALGMPAHRNLDVTTQVKHGDVLFTMTDGSHRSIESQASHSHTRFSYNLKKFQECTGPGLPEHAYVMLSCLQERGSSERVYAIVQAVHLHEYLKNNGRVFQGGYFVISPGDLTGVSGIRVCGDSIEEVVNEFAHSLVGT